MYQKCKEGKAIFCLQIRIAQAKRGLYGDNIQTNCKYAQKTFDKLGVL